MLSLYEYTQALRGPSLGFAPSPLPRISSSVLTEPQPIAPPRLSRAPCAARTDSALPAHDGDAAPALPARVHTANPLRELQPRRERGTATPIPNRKPDGCRGDAGCRTCREKSRAWDHHTRVFTPTALKTPFGPNNKCYVLCCYTAQGVLKTCCWLSAMGSGRASPSAQPRHSQCITQI